MGFLLKEHLSRLGGDGRDLLDGVGDGGGTEVGVLGDGGCTSLLAGTNHGIFKTRVDQLVLLCSMDDSATFLGGQLTAGVFFHQCQKLALAGLFPFTRHAAETDMRQVLQPLWERGGRGEGREGERRREKVNKCETLHTWLHRAHTPIFFLLQVIPAGTWVNNMFMAHVQVFKVAKGGGGSSEICILCFSSSFLTSK